MEADLNVLKDALNYKDERQLRDIVPRLIHEGLLEVERRLGKPDVWRVTRDGRTKIRFLTFPVVAYAILIVFGFAAIAGGVNSFMLKVQIQPSDLVGIGSTILTFGVFLWLMSRNLEKEILRVENQDEPSQ